MNKPMAILQLRKPPDPRQHDLTKFGGISAAGRAQLTWAQSITLQLDDALGKIRDQVNTMVQGVGAALASTPLITLSAATQHVTGTGTITTINPPSGFSGPTWLISDDGFSLGPGGNINTTGVLVPKGAHVQLTYDPMTALWSIPTAVAPNASTFAARPANPALGATAAFTDSTTNTWGAIIAGGGAFTVLGWWNGTNWTVIGK